MLHCVSWIKVVKMTVKGMPNSAYLAQLTQYLAK